MTHPMEGLIAPEGVYLPTSSYTLPPAPSFPPLASSATLSSNATAMANTISSGGGSGSAGQVGGSGSSATNQSSSYTSNSSSGAGGSGPNGNGADGNSENGLTETDLARTALHHISMTAPSAWSHVIVVPPSKISVASIRYPAAPANNRRDRQQSSYMSAAEVFESNNNDSETSLPGGGDAAGMASASGISDSTALPIIGPILEATLASQGIDGPASHVTGGSGGLPGMTALQLLAHLGGGPPPSMSAANLATGNSLGNGTTAANKNLSKPKNNIKQTSSSFVQRLQNHNDYTKLFGPRTEGNTIERFGFVSRNRILYWLGETANGWIKDPIARLTFATSITSHDVNQLTRSPSRLDVAIAFSTSDIVWFEAMSSRYSRLNKAGCVNDSPITNIRWVPGSETLLLTCHSDGTCTIFDTSREDSANGSWVPIRGLTLKAGEVSQDADPSEETQGREEVGEAEEAQEVLVDRRRPSLDRRSSTTGSAATLSSTTSAGKAVEVDGQGLKPSIKSWDPTSRMLVTRPATQEAGNDAGSKKAWSKLNPVAHWRVTRSSSISDVAFSPDHTKIAIVSTDGLLRIINLLTETLEGSFESYYGALNKVVFSPDAKFILTAGCDDLVSVWTSDGRLLSRCPGHTSFVTSIAFDPWRWKVEDKTYRFASVGEDGRVILWDFSSAALVRPKTPHSGTLHQKRGVGGGAGINGGSTFSLLQDQHLRRNSGGPRRPSMTAEGGFEKSATYLRALPRGEVAELQPVASYQLGGIAANDPTISNKSTTASTAMTASTSTMGAAAAAGAGGAGALTGQTTSSSANTPGGNSTNANEAGSASDLLVDVRFRQDGILIMHKSGTLRFLQRPRHRAISRAIPVDSTMTSRRDTVR